MNETILVSLVGATPAVLSETVWAMATAEEPVFPDRIVAITTSYGAERLKQLLFEDGHWPRMISKLKEQGLDIEGKLRFGPVGDSIRVFPNRARTAELDDVRSLEDNETIADFYMELIRSFTENDSTTLVVSIAGGRKTTSALLHSVMTLLGRSQDSINHILINDEWIGRDFVYPGCEGEFHDSAGNPLDSSDAELQLVDVPFVPLRYLFERDLQTNTGFTNLITKIRDKSVSVDELMITLDVEKQKLTVNECSIDLSANEYLFYLYYARYRMDGNEDDPVRYYADLQSPLESLKSTLVDRHGDFHWSYDSLKSGFDASNDVKAWASEVRRKLASAGFQNFENNLLVPCRGSMRIDVPPENITII